VRWWIQALAAALAVAWPSHASAQVDPDPLIAPVVFHWAQAQTAWPTLEGGSVDGSSVRFWRRQIALMETAGFTGQLFQVADGAVDSARNHLVALRERRLEQPGGPLPPRIVPFFAAETFPDYGTPKDVLTAQGFETFYQAIRGFFVMYASIFPARAGQKGPLDPELFARVDGRVVIALWWVPLASYDLPPSFFQSLSDRLERDFGFRAYWSVHAFFAKGGPDDVNYLFNGPEPIHRGVNTTHPAVDLLVGFWPPNATYPLDMFVPRNGGSTYSAAWDVVIASRPAPSIVFVESYNEITEGSHLMPSWPVSHAKGDGHWTGPPDAPPCQMNPCHPLEFTDTWGGDNPWLYLDITRRKIREWRFGLPPAGEDLVPPHVFIVTPAWDAVLTGAAPIQIAAADDKALGAVRLYLDGWLLLTERGSFTRTLKSWNLANGRHAFVVDVSDLAGNRDADSRDVVVSNRDATPVPMQGVGTTALTGASSSSADDRPIALPAARFGFQYVWLAAWRSAGVGR
jgi:hypothetical protein